MCSLPALLQAALLPGISLADATKLFSLNPAKSVGLSAEVGSIEAGKAADCVLVDAHSAVPKVLATMVMGRNVYSAGAYLY